MVDLGAPSPAGFDRTRLPVRYYRIDFSRAIQYEPAANPYSRLFVRDVRDCGHMFAPLVDEVPQIGGKLRTLINAMIGGEYAAEDARKLFEALCRTIDHATYESLLEPALVATA